MTDHYPEGAAVPAAPDTIGGRLARVVARLIAVLVVAAVLTAAYASGYRRGFARGTGVVGDVVLCALKADPKSRACLKVDALLSDGGPA